MVLEIGGVYNMAFVSLNEDQTQVIGIFNMPQNDPVPYGYFGELPDDDARVIEFKTKQGN